MEEEKNIITKENQYLKENIQMVKDGKEKEKNIRKMMNYIMMGNI